MPSRTIETRRAPSLLTRATLAMLLVITVVFSLHAAYQYSSQKTEIVNLMNQNIQKSLERLSKNIVPFVEAYAVNEYEKLIATEAALEGHFAVLVQDLKMGDIIGAPYYVSGQILTEAGNYISYRSDSPMLKERLNQAAFSDTVSITGTEGEVLGKLSVYASDEALVSKLRSVLVQEFIIGLVVVVTLTLLLVFVLQRYFLRSIEQINNAMRNCDQDGIPLQPVPVSPYREVRLLSHTINNMLKLIKREKEIRTVEQRRLQNAISGTRTGTWEWNVSTGETVFNERWAHIIGYSLEELEPISIETWMNFTHPDDLKRSGELLERHFSGELPSYECEARMRHRDGHWVWVLDRGSVLSWTDDGQPLMMYGTHQDISARKESDSKLSMAASVFRYAREGIVLVSASGDILDVNSAFCSLTGYARDEVAQQSYEFLASDRHSQDFFKAILESLREEGIWIGECWMPCRNGSAFPSLVTIAAVRNADGDTKHYVALIADISSFKENEDKLRKIAHYDSLTGLPNRALMTERLSHAVSQARRRNDVLAVVFLDLDGFKEVNDTQGHAAGDELLTILAKRMKDALRECDTVARFGGDEFVLLLPDLPSREDCEPILDRLIEALAAPAVLSSTLTQVSASIGVSFYSQSVDVDGDTLVREADMAMYQAKESGKNRYRFFNNVRDGTEAAQQTSS